MPHGSDPHRSGLRARREDLRRGRRLPGRVAAALVALLLASLPAACGGGKGGKGAAGDGAAGPGTPPGGDDDCREHPQGPTRAQCGEVVAHLARIMPGDMNNDDPQQDICDCLAMPKELIACLGTIVDRNGADECVDKFVPSGGGPAHASREDCEAAVAHLEQVDETYAHDIAGSEDEIVADCVENATPEEVQCILGASSREDVEKCDR